MFFLILANNIQFTLKTAIILGSGLSKIRSELRESRILYSDPNGFHKAEVIEGELFGNEVILFSGRRHFYEGYSPEEMLFFVNMAHEQGVELLIISNAAGGINPALKVSDLMVITSYINFMKIKLPKGRNNNSMSTDRVRLIKKLGLRNFLNLKFGTYCCNSGPNYETRSEIRFLLKAGIDAIGMSTVPEIITAKSLGINVVGISCISNTLAENTKFETNHDEVVEACLASYDRFSRLIELVLTNSNEIIGC